MSFYYTLYKADDFISYLILNLSEINIFLMVNLLFTGNKRRHNIKKYNSNENKRKNLLNMWLSGTHRPTIGHVFNGKLLCPAQGILD